MKIHLAIFCGLLFCLQINAQINETLVRKLPNGSEIYQRKSESTTTFPQNQSKNISVLNTMNLDNQEFASQELELFLRNKNSKEEEIIWRKELIFPINERAFNFFNVLDVYHWKDIYYVLYFERLELKVVTALKNSSVWQTENETFLEMTSESINPITEAKFASKKKPQIFAKRGFEFNFTVYEWKLKKGKWFLTKEKTVKSPLPQWK